MIFHSLKAQARKKTPAEKQGRGNLKECFERLKSMDTMMNVIFYGLGVIGLCFALGFLAFLALAVIDHGKERK